LALFTVTFYLTDFAYANNEGVGSNVYKAIEAMLAQDQKFESRAKCMTDHFEEIKIIDRFYSLGMEKDYTEMLQELAPYLPDVYDSCVPKNGSSLDSNWLVLVILASIGAITLS
jgi:hypothetical protein